MFTVPKELLPLGQSPQLSRNTGLIPGAKQVEIANAGTCIPMILSP